MDGWVLWEAEDKMPNLFKALCLNVCQIFDSFTFILIYVLFEQMNIVVLADAWSGMVHVGKLWLSHICQTTAWTTAEKKSK